MSKVHIVFGVYKRTTYFKKCIDSIKNQITHHDVSLVIDGPNNDLGVIENINLFIDTFKHKYDKIDYLIELLEGCELTNNDKVKQAAPLQEL